MTLKDERNGRRSRGVADFGSGRSDHEAAEHQQQEQLVHPDSHMVTTGRSRERAGSHGEAGLRLSGPGFMDREILQVRR